ncbi:hypothetical protein [Lysinibacillus xylanilyticus]|uniref:HNH/Endo VII superfamily nuclease toxins domain-containing protein n=1 Tax=Lysinibacillus xylanilyticus TaxID=582475 RepID=A0ABT4EID3_9BACI|nr:hypothetical protein [Lysinibacillus xylanilyticus]MCY9545415.1 hypothetical protein [Lysinibacillus xylanilyticus]
MHDPNIWIDVFGLNSASLLKQLRGISVSQLEKILTHSGFNQTRVTSTGNQTWNHTDGSKVMIHPYGDVRTGPYKTGNNGHVHKYDPSGSALNDKGLISTYPNETHIGIKNPKYLPEVRGRNHGEGCR